MDNFQIQPINLKQIKSIEKKLSVFGSKKKEKEIQNIWKTRRKQGI